MRRAGLVGLLCCASVALAVPPVPMMDLPFDGGWGARRPRLNVVLDASTPPDVTATEFEITNPGGAVVYSGFEPFVATGAVTHLSGTIPDAGFFSWRARGVDDAGVTSPWATAAWFRMDDLPATPTTVTAGLDGSVLIMSSSIATDSQSGLKSYHFVISQVDGGIINPGTLSINGPSPFASARLGPGSWSVGGHPHDNVDNTLPNNVAGPYVVIASPAIPAPGIRVSRLDGGTYATDPYIPTSRVRFRVDAGSTAVTAYTFIRLTRGVPGWDLIGEGTPSTGGLVLFTMPYGDQDVRVAVHSGGQVSEWSQPVRVFVDDLTPRMAVVTASRDGGQVQLQWGSPGDNPNAPSGIEHYTVTRCCRDDGGSVALANLAEVLDGSISLDDVLPKQGTWTYSVTAFDRAGNAGVPGLATTSWPPDRPTGLQVADAITKMSVQLSWDPAGLVTWDVSRVDAADAGQSVAVGLASASFVDFAPDGVWSYEVVARLGALSSEPARLDGVVRDQTFPAVNVPTVRRVGAREGEVSWMASDALSGLAGVVLERESDGVVSSLGPVPSPFLDAPPDGVHRYRVVATDQADNVSTSGWSTAFITPGAGVQIVRPDSLTAVCGRALEVTLSATELVTWAIVSGPAVIDATSGALTMSGSEAGTVEVVISAQGATSADVITVPVEVSCTKENYSLGCACDSGGSLWLILLVLLLAPSPLRGRGSR